MRKFLTRLTFGCCLGALCAMSGNVLAQSTWTSGHGDIGVAYEGPNDLYVHWHMEGGIVDGMAADDVEFDGNQLIAEVNANHLLSRPAGAEWDLVGNSAGENTWWLPQSNSDPTFGAAATGKPFLGWAAEEGIIASEWSDFMWEITDFSGPGEFSVWQDGFTPSFFLSTAGDPSDLMTPGPGLEAHDHFNWGFTAPGYYEVELTVSGTHSVDGFSTGSGRFGFQVVPEPGSFVVLGSLGAVSLLVRRRRKL